MNTEPTGFSQHALDDYTRLESRFRTLQHEAYAYKRQRDAIGVHARAIITAGRPHSTRCRKGCPRCDAWDALNNYLNEIP